MTVIVGVTHRLHPHAVTLLICNTTPPVESKNTFLRNRVLCRFVGHLITTFSTRDVPAHTRELNARACTRINIPKPGLVCTKRSCSPSECLTYQTASAQARTIASWIWLVLALKSMELSSNRCDSKRLGGWLELEVILFAQFSGQREIIFYFLFNL